MTIDSVQRLYHALYSDVNGMLVSKQARAQLQLDDKSLIYGELNSDVMGAILAELDLAPDALFYDLGSGSGKAVILAALMGSFSECVGVELLAPLHELSESVLFRLKQLSFEYLNEINLPKIQFKHGNMLNEDISKADLVFAHATCFDDTLIQSLKKNCRSMKKGAYLATVTKSFSMSDFELVYEKRHSFSWGEGTVYIQIKAR